MKGDSSRGTKDGGAMIHRVVHEVDGGTSYPCTPRSTTRIGHGSWVKLKAWALWRTLNVTDVDPKEVMMAFDVLFTTLAPSPQSPIRTK